MALPFWIEFFEDLQHIRGRSQNTVLAYRRDLEFWQTYSETSTSVSGFYDFLKKNGLSVRSQARVISSLRTYFRFCENQGRSSPELRELRPPRVKAKLPHAMTPSEFQKLIQACEVPDRSKAIRNQMTLLFLYGLGCRVSELIELDIGDFHPTERWVKIVGKGRKERLVPLTELLVRQLDTYLKESRPFLIKDSSACLLVNDRGHRPSRVDIWRWLAAWSKLAGFSEPIHPHRFRHGCATALLDGGADLRSIQLILGHASLQTTQIYTSVSPQHLTTAIDESHPLSVKN